jgi:hypothetical protein
MHDTYWPRARPHPSRLHRSWDHTSQAICQRSDTVAFNEAGKLLDAVAVPADDSITTVIIRLPSEYDRMQLTVWGDRVDASVPRDVIYIATSDKLGGTGEFRIHVKRGVVVAIDGNGLESGTELPFTLLQEVAKVIDSGELPRGLIEILRN